MPAVHTRRSDRRLVTDLIEAWNAHDADRIAACAAADYVGIDVAEAEPRRGAEAWRASAVGYLTAFPDLSITPEEILYRNGRAAVHWTARGTHLGTFLHIPPTGRAVCVRGVSLLTLAGGRIQQGTYVWDVAGFLRAVGLLPELPRALSSSPALPPIVAPR